MLQLEVNKHMERFTLETGLEESMLELQQVYQTIYEAMIKADETEVKMQRKAKLEGANVADELVAYQEAMGEKMASAARSIGTFVRTKIEAFIKLIREFTARAVESMKKKASKEMAASVSQAKSNDTEITWYKDFSKISTIIDCLSTVFKDVLKDLEVLNDKSAADMKKDYSLSDIEDMADDALEKEQIKLTDCSQLNSPEKINKAIDYLLNTNQKIIDTLDRAIRSKRIMYWTSAVAPGGSVLNAWSGVLLDSLKLFKRVLVDYSQTLNAVISKVVTHAPAANNEAAINFDPDLVYEAMIYEFNHVMDGVYVNSTGELITEAANEYNAENV